MITLYPGRTHSWEAEHARRRQRRQALRWLTLAACLLAVPAWLLLAAPVVRDTTAAPLDDDPAAPQSTTYLVSAADLYTPEPTDAWGMTAAERGIVERVVEQEARGEPYLGQMAVAQCIRQAAEDDGLTPYEVVMQDGQYADPASSASASVRAAVQAVLYDGEDAVHAAIRWFYAPGVSGESGWHETRLAYVCAIGNHRFFAAKEGGE